MPIDLICKACSRVMRAPDDAAGKLVRCPHCQAVNEVPLTAELMEGATAEPSPFARPRCNMVLDENTAGMAEPGA